MGAGTGVTEVIALILVGIGFFLYGMEIVAGAIKMLSGHHTRKLLSRWTGHKSVGMLFGFISGAVSQSGSKASLIMANLMASRLITLRNAIPIVAAANLGTVLIVFLVSIDIKLATLYYLALFLLLFCFSRNAGRKPLINVFLGIGILLFGFLLLQSGAKPLLAIPSLQNVLAHMGGGALYGWFPFMIGIVLRLVAQSTSAVIVIAVTFLHAGGLDIDQAMFLVFGAIMGSGISTWLMGAKLKGTSRQLALFQMVYDASSSLIMTVLAIVEILCGLPLVKALTGWIANDPNQQLAYVYLASRLLGFGVSMTLRNHIVALLERVSPPSRQEQLSKPEYIYDEAAQDPLSSLSLVEKEHLRIMRRLPTYLEKLRKEHESEDYIEHNELHTVTQELGVEVRNFIGVVMHQDMPRETSELFIRIQKRQDFMMLAEDNLFTLVNELDKWQVAEDLSRVRDNMVESLHAVLSICVDATKCASADEIAQVIKITDDKSGLMEKMREECLSGPDRLTAANRAAFLHITDLYQRIIWLMHQWALTHRNGAAAG
jgi:phosphate:Na+ symporter